MLSAKNIKGETVILSSEIPRQELRILRAQMEFYCPVCNGGVYLKVGTKKIPHFSHQKDSLCAIHGESMQHLQGKEKLYQWIKRKQKRVELEKYIPNIKQRADVFFHYYDEQVALEYQCSTISEDVFLQRTRGYQQEDIHVLWVFGENQFECKRYGYKVNEFLSLGAIFQRDGFRFIFYSEEKDSFFILGPVFSFTTTLLFAHLQMLPRKTTSFPQLFTLQWQLPPTLLQDWYYKKRKYRLYGHRYFYPHNLPFIQFLRTYALAPGYFPSEAGIPLRKGYFFKTSPIIWQSYLLLEFLVPLEIEESFTLYECVQYVEQKCQEGVIKKRLLPLVKELTLLEDVIREYFLVLCHFQVLEKKNNVYIKRRNPFLPRSLEEGMKMDKQMGGMIAKSLREGIQ